MRKRYRKTITNTVLALILVILYMILKTKIGITVDQRKVSLEEHWSVTVNGVDYSKEYIKDVFFSVTNIGDSVELKTTLPACSFDRPTLQFRIYHSVIAVYVGNEKIYQYGDELYDAHKMVGSGYQWVNLPEDYQGKELKIRFDVTEDSAFSSFENISIMSGNDVMRNFVLQNIIEIIIGVFLFSFGALLLGVVIFFHKLSKEYQILFWIAVFSQTVAIWMMSNFGILQIPFENLHTIAYFEYISLYFAPIPMLLFVCNLQDNKRTNQAIYALITSIALFDIVAIVLNELNIYHFSKILPIFHVFGFLTVALTVISNLYVWKKKNRKSERMVLYGLIIMAVFLFADILRFNIDKYFHPRNINLTNSILPIGVLSFVISMITSYIYRLVQLFYESAEKETLIHIAYTDALTKIGNRAMCEKMFQERQNLKKEATVINFDLNHFKEVNDTFGHSIGDELLIEFAKVLQENYEKDGFVGRMGGDEFIVVLDTTDNSYIEKTIEELMKKIAKVNQEGKCPYQISVAYGYSSNKDNTDCSLWDIYQKSDKKMYQNKEANR